MQNLDSVAQKMAELGVLLYFCILFRLSIRTFMQNLDSVAQEMSELCSIYVVFGAEPCRRRACDQPT